MTPRENHLWRHNEPLSVKGEGGNKPPRQSGQQRLPTPRPFLPTPQCLLPEAFKRSEIYLRFYFTQIVHLNGKIGYFSSRKSSVSSRFGRSFQNVYCLKRSVHTYGNNDVSGSAWNKSFIQMKKCSYLNKRIIYRSMFLACRSRLVIFASRIKILCFSTRRRIVSKMFFCLKHSVR